MNGRVCSLALLGVFACLTLGAATPGKVQVEWSEAGGEKWTIEGFADRETGRPMAKDTMFSVCSNTKTATSALVLTFVEEGKLSLDDPVSKFFPAFKDSRVTVRHLLAHTSGLPYEADRKRCRDAVPLAEQVAIAAEKGNAKAAIDATGFDGGRATFACSDVSRKGDVVSVKVVNVDDRHGANKVVLRSGGKVVVSKRVELRIGEAKTVRFDVGGLAPDAAVSVEVEK